MKKRCPASTYRGIARLPSYRWLINERGYANVVQTCDDKDEVWGLVFELQQTDEVKLDINEGVPEAYTKEDLSVDFWPVSETGRPKVHEEPLRIEMLLYIDRRRMEPSIPKKEYIYRMNMGVIDAREEGMPTVYVDNIIRKFIPDVRDDSIVKFAQQQAHFFDESADTV